MKKTSLKILLSIAIIFGISSNSSSMNNENFSISQKLESNNAEDYYNWGRISYLQSTRKGFEDSISYFDKAIEIDKNYSLALSAKSEAQSMLSTYYNRNKMKQVNLEIEAFKNAYLSVKLDPDSVEAHRSLSLAYSFKGLYDEGEKEAKKAINLNKYDAESYLMLWVSNSKPKLNDPIIEKALGLNPYIPITPLIFSFYCIDQDNNRKARVSLDKVLSINPNNDLAYSLLGALSLYENNNNDKAIELLEKAIKIDPYNEKVGYVNYALGRAYFNKWNMKKAIEHQKKGCDEDFKASCDWLIKKGYK